MKHEMQLEPSVLRRIRWVLGCFVLALILSGITAFPLQGEMELLVSLRGLKQVAPGQVDNSFDRWILTVRDGLRESYATHPWLGYGTDWLAFAHIVIAIFFWGPLVDPIRNIWVFRAGIIACGLVIPLALICGAVRQIPWGWRLIDCSFGAFGCIPLWYCIRLVKKADKNLWCIGARERW